MVIDSLVSFPRHTYFNLIITGAWLINEPGGLGSLTLGSARLVNESGSSSICSTKARLVKGARFGSIKESRLVND